MSLGFSMAAMTRAAKSSFSQVFFKLIMGTPSHGGGKKWLAIFTNLIGHLYRELDVCVCITNLVSLKRRARLSSARL